MREAVLTGTGTGEPVDAQVQSGTKTRRVTVITGASGGIGADLARVFASHGHDLVLIARSHAPLEALAGEIEASGALGAGVRLARTRRTGANRRRVKSRRGGAGDFGQ